MKPYNKMNYVIAENKYITYLRDGGWRGELYYPNEKASKQSEDGTWLLLTLTGKRLGTVSPRGTVRI